MPICERRPAGGSVFAALEEDHRDAFRNLDSFYESLRNLRFEGKKKWGKNLKDVAYWVGYFNKEILGHMKKEEKALFPFLQTHIPRLDPMVHLLLSEHDEFRHRLKELVRLVARFKRGGADGPRLIQDIDENGTYLICLLRSHMQVETQSLYWAADHELHPGERKTLIRRIQTGRK